MARHHRAGPIVPQQDEPAVRVDDIEHHVHDAAQEPIHVVALGEHVGDPIERPETHDARPHLGHVLAAGKRQVRVRARRRRRHDGTVNAPLGVHLDREAPVVHQGTVLHGPTDRHDGVAHADLVPCLDLGFADAHAIDEGAVRRPGIHEDVPRPLQDQPGVRG